MASASDILVARALGKPVVALAKILQQSPSAVITRAKNNIQRPQDLGGNKVAVAVEAIRAGFLPVFPNSLTRLRLCESLKTLSMID